MADDVGDRLERRPDEETVVAGQGAGGEASSVEAVGGLESDQGACGRGRGPLDHTQEFIGPADELTVAPGALRTRGEAEDQAPRDAGDLEEELVVAGGDGGDPVGPDPGDADAQPDPGAADAHHGKPGVFAAASGAGCRSGSCSHDRSRVATGGMTGA
ncbi:hypothetical protein AB0I68_36590 [Streptomyces sp. NPDC050448]|uniref:hypothetical protein n=1 Tax=Streptomyces sp. NPDC050448 TaxID=3155404 RepID=UPI00343BB5A3